MQVNSNGFFSSPSIDSKIAISKTCSRSGGLAFAAAAIFAAIAIAAAVGFKGNVKSLSQTAKTVSLSIFGGLVATGGGLLLSGEAFKRSARNEYRSEWTKCLSQLNQYSQKQIYPNFNQ